jgi:hypothetical protein
LSVLHELCLELELTQSKNVQIDADWMPTTDSVLSVLDVLIEALSIVVLDEVHALPIKLFDTLPDQPIVLVVVAELETAAPMAEIAADDEKCVGLLEIWKQQFSVVLLHLQIGSPNHNRHQLNLIAQSLFNVWKVHLQTMLFLLIVLFDCAEFPSLT